ncbi:MAG: cellulase family glycosylhydrolase, partial [Candidatus Sumerlaeota bacterium]|nr:cellulase family glycosylhydrolase [Candidatus Sumerlaeota bacterium]
PYLQGVQKLVEEFGKRHIAVILNMHQYAWSPAFRHIAQGKGTTYGEGVGMPAWLYPKAPDPCESADVHRAQVDFLSNRSEAGPDVPPPLDGFVDAWKEVAARFAGNPTVVGADLLNEPSVGRPKTGDEIPLAECYARLAKEVSAANPRLLIIFEDVVRGTAGQPILPGPPPVPNAVYSLHVYAADWKAAAPWLEAHWENARTWGVPLWIGEFNAFNHAKNQGAPQGTQWSKDLGDLLDYCRDKGIGWCFWAYYGASSIVDLETRKPKADLLSALQAGF